MPTLRALEGASVTDAKGTSLGKVTRVLCDPEKAAVVGFEVQPPNVAYVVSRKLRYFALAGAKISGTSIEVEDPKSWSGERAEKRLGFEWERTVIWVGMPVGPPTGEPYGYVRDATFYAETGAISRILVSDGLTSDLAVGTREYEGSLVDRFDGSVIRLSEAADSEFSGGFARTAGTSAAVAKVVVSDAAKRAADLGGSAVKAAAKSKPARGAWSVLRETGRAFREGLEDGKDRDD